MKKLICSLIVVTALPFFNPSEASTTPVSTTGESISSVKDGIETLMIHSNSIIIHKIGENQYQAIFSDMNNISSEELKNAEKSWYKNSPTSFANIPPTGWLGMWKASVTAKFTGFHYDESKHQVIVDFSCLTNLDSGKIQPLPKGLVLDKQYTKVGAQLFIITTMPTE